MQQCGEGRSFQEVWLSIGAWRLLLDGQVAAAPQPDVVSSCWCQFSAILLCRATHRSWQRKGWPAPAPPGQPPRLFCCVWHGLFFAEAE